MGQIYELSIDVMQALKEQTRADHESVERIMPFFREAFSIEEYGRVLEAFFGYFEPIERRLIAVSGWESAGIHVRRRLRSHLLRNDLRCLGRTESEIDALPRCGDLPMLDGLTEAFGTLYVLEGSTLGGQMIATEVNRRLGLDRRDGVSFFVSEGRNVGLEWRSLCAAVRKQINTSDQTAIAVSIASATFRSLEEWLRAAGFHD